AGHRRFDAEAVDRVLLVQRLFAAGLSSNEIAPVMPALLGLRDTTASLTALRAHRERLAQEIARLRDTAEILDEVLEEHERSCALREVLPHDVENRRPVPSPGCTRPQWAAPLEGETSWPSTFC